MKRTKEVADAVDRLKDQSSFKTLISALQTHRDELFRKSVFTNENVDIARGMAREADELLKTLSGK